MKKRKVATKRLAALLALVLAVGCLGGALSAYAVGPQEEALSLREEPDTEEKEATTEEMSEKEATTEEMSENVDDGEVEPQMEREEASGIGDDAEAEVKEDTKGSVSERAVTGTDALVADLAAMIDGLPTLVQVPGMDAASRDAAYATMQEVYDALAELDAKTRAEVEAQLDMDKLERLAEWFAAATVYLKDIDVGGGYVLDLDNSGTADHTLTVPYHTFVYCNTNADWSALAKEYASYKYWPSTITLNAHFIPYDTDHYTAPTDQTDVASYPQYDEVKDYIYTGSEDAPIRVTLAIPDLPNTVEVNSLLYDTVICYFLPNEEYGTDWTLYTNAILTDDTFDTKLRTNDGSGVESGTVSQSYLRHFVFNDEESKKNVQYVMTSPASVSMIIENSDVYDGIKQPFSGRSATDYISSQSFHYNLGRAYKLQYSTHIWEDLETSDPTGHGDGVSVKNTSNDDVDSTGLEETNQNYDQTDKNYSDNNIYGDTIAIAPDIQEGYSATITIMTYDPLFGKAGWEEADADIREAYLDEGMTAPTKVTYTITWGGEDRYFLMFYDADGEPQELGVYTAAGLNDQITYDVVGETKIVVTYSAVPGGIEVEKQINGAYNDEAFTFEVKLSDETINGNGTDDPTDDSYMNFENGVAAFELKNGEKKSGVVPIADSNDPITYTVTETDSKGYTVSMTSGYVTDATTGSSDTESISGEIKAGDTALVLVTNTEPPVRPASSSGTGTDTDIVKTGTSSGTDIVKTGDAGFYMLWIALIAAAGGVCTLALVGRRRKKTACV